MNNILVFVGEEVQIKNGSGRQGGKEVECKELRGF
jgi:hypothetical protein